MGRDIGQEEIDRIVAEIAKKRAERAAKKKAKKSK